MRPREDHVTAANDRGPGRYVGDRAVPVQELAAHLGLGDEQIRDLFFEHDEEISFRIFEAVVDIVVEIGLREGLIPLEEPLEPEGAELELLEP